MRYQIKIFHFKILFRLLCLFLLIINVHLGYSCILQKNGKKKPIRTVTCKKICSLFSLVISQETKHFFFLN